MHQSTKHHLKLFFSLTLLIIGSGSQRCFSEIDLVRLETSSVKMEITPDLGGRVLQFSVPGMPNILKIGEEELAKPQGEISGKSDFVGYFGHINWLSPQSAWWKDQNINLNRKNNQSIWPPDPYLIFSKNEIIKKSQDLLILKGAKSPITGIQFRKTFTLVTNKPGTIDLNVKAENISADNVSWGIWFNTRVNPHATVYVPVTGKNSVRIENYNEKLNLPVNFQLQDNFLSFQHYEFQNNQTKIRKENIRGKAFIRPAKGWMAAFIDGQVFVIQFPLQENKKIHEKHGQIEIYHSYKRGEQSGGELEMEVHAPLVTLKPGDVMEAVERWSVLPYPGQNTRTSHLQFLQELLNKNIIAEIN